MLQSTLNTRSITRTRDGQVLAYRAYNIIHRTEYTYQEAVQRSEHHLRLQPVEDASQEVISSVIRLSQSGEEIRYDDVFGNQALFYAMSTPFDRLVIECQNQVKVFARPADEYKHTRQKAFPLVWMPWQRQMMTPYLLPPELPESQLYALTDYAMEFFRRNEYDLIESLKDMNQTIYRDFEYVPGSTSVNTTAFEVYASRKGVCQDFANLFICMARLLNIPARYRMGYIYTGGNYENKIQSDASHAWVELYLPYVGWRGFDPTNGVAVSQDHIRVACGRNYIDATPTSGTIYQGGGGEKLTVQVKVEEIQL